ncbi:MAG: hypothetical protein DWP97_09670 [Calditrichaeota bacterium]|nr:MAG: hypothetical protein DWP97_09670 [Calditrichota bacterium]
MINKTIFIILFFVLRGTLASQVDEGCFLKIQFYQLENNELTSLGAASTDMCRFADGIFYKDKNQVGIKSGIVNNNKSVDFELIYSLRAGEVRGDNRLYGTCYSFQYTDSSSFLIGVKKVIDTSIELNEELKIPVGKLPNENKVFVGITLIDEMPDMKHDENTAITLITSDNTDFNAVNNKYTLTEMTNFSTGTYIRKDGKINQLKYQIEINLPDLPNDFESPFETELLFKRKYLIDEDFFEMNSFQVDYTFKSEYRKKVTLIPGETIMFVFPPDTPSVRGFDMMDTLYIRP